MKRFSDEEIVKIRNDIAVVAVIEKLLKLPHKEVEGVYRFLCPICNEFNTGLNPNTNLCRCFGCKKNYNPIDLVMAERGLRFVESINLLRSFASPDFYQKGQRDQPSKDSTPKSSLNQLTQSEKDLLLKLAQAFA